MAVLDEVSRIPYAKIRISLEAKVVSFEREFLEFGTRNLCTVLTRKDTVLSRENRKQTVFVDVTPRDSCLRVFNAPFITYSR